jgi:hypothetical protein
MSSNIRQEVTSGRKISAFSIASLESSYLPSLFANEGVQDAKREISRQQMQTFFKNIGNHYRFNLTFYQPLITIWAQVKRVH